MSGESFAYEHNGTIYCRLCGNSHPPVTTRTDCLRARYDMADIGGKRYWALRPADVHGLIDDVEQLERERDEARAEVEHLRRGVETYQRMLWETTETPGSTERKMLYAEEMLVWEREDAERRESGDDQAAGTRL